MAKKMASTRRDTDRRDRPREREYQLLKASWEKRKVGSRTDIYGDPVSSLRDAEDRYVDGRRLADDLRRISKLTGDPIFNHALDALRAYELHQHSPAKAAKAINALFLNDRIYEETMAVEIMDDLKLDAKAKSKHFSAHMAAAKAVEVVFTPAVWNAGFDSLVAYLRKSYPKKSPRGTPPPDFGKTARYLTVLPAPGYQPTRPDQSEKEIPAEGVRLPDTRALRQLIYSGVVSVIFGK